MNETKGRFRGEIVRRTDDQNTSPEAKEQVRSMSRKPKLSSSHETIVDIRWIELLRLDAATRFLLDGREF